MSAKAGPAASRTQIASDASMVRPFMTRRVSQDRSGPKAGTDVSVPSLARDESDGYDVSLRLTAAQPDARQARAKTEQEPTVPECTRPEPDPRYRPARRHGKLDVYDAPQRPIRAHSPFIALLNRRTEPLYPGANRNWRAATRGVDVPLREWTSSKAAPASNLSRFRGE